MIKAVWDIDYDMASDSTFDRPSHEGCGPVILCEDKYICIGCGEEIEVDEDMKKWIKEREGFKQEVNVCISCGKKTMYSTYLRNEKTLEWRCAYGECSNCGLKFIV